MTIDAFIARVPDKIANDPELRDYFNQLNRSVSDLTTQRGDAIADVLTTATNAQLATALNAILAQMRIDGDIKT